MQPVTMDGLRPSLDLVEVIDRLHRAIAEVQAQVSALDARIAALEALHP
ncbi:MAG: hypothetical protein AB7U34_03295 [Novosphingobium sp.]